MGEEQALFHNYISLHSGPTTNSPENITLGSLTPRTRMRCQDSSYGLIHWDLQLAFMHYPIPIRAQRQYQYYSASPCTAQAAAFSESFTQCNGFCCLLLCFFLETAHSTILPGEIGLSNVD